MNTYDEAKAEVVVVKQRATDICLLSGLKANEFEVRIDFALSDVSGKPKNETPKFHIMGIIRLKIKMIPAEAVYNLITYFQGINGELTLKFDFAKT
jgi:hypothetical protein